MGIITKDYKNSLVWGFISVVMGIVSLYLAYDQLESFFVAPLGGVFVLGGIALIAKSQWWRLDFQGLLAEGEKPGVWISVHNTGSGESSATSLLVKVYPSKTAQKAPVTFEANETRNLNAVMEGKKKAALLKRRRDAGMGIFYLGEQMVLPSSDVRYSGRRNSGTGN